MYKTPVGMDLSPLLILASITITLNKPTFMAPYASLRHWIVAHIQGITLRTYMKEGNHGKIPNDLDIINILPLNPIFMAISWDCKV